MKQKRLHLAKNELHAKYVAERAIEYGGVEFC